VIALLDLGGTKLAAAVAAAPDAQLENVRRIPTPAEAPLPALCSLLDEVTEGRPPLAIALSVPGPFDREAGTLLRPPGLLPSWHGLALGAALRERYGCPVTVENDANCAALAEAREGAGREARTVVYFTVSTGIGTGIVHDGTLLATRQDTEGGHQVLWPEWLGGPDCHCGGAGCLEALASGLAIQRRFGRPGEELDDQASWDDVGRWLGLGVVNAVALHDPDIVIFGGGVCASWDRFASSLRTTAARHLRLQPVPEIALGTLGEQRNLLGAKALLSVAP
jgi:glucokinase